MLGFGWLGGWSFNPFSLSDPPTHPPPTHSILQVKVAGSVIRKQTFNTPTQNVTEDTGTKPNPPTHRTHPTQPTAPT